MSIINKKHRHVFVHVPKCGGTSMYRHPFVRGQSHHTAAELLPKAPPGYFSWAFVRNPYDRTLSTYCAALQHGGRWPKVQDLTFAEYVRELKNGWPVQPHARPQTHFVCDKHSNVLVDFVGRFESIEEDWKTVCRRIGIDPVPPLGHKNKSQHRPWREEFDDELIEIVNEAYASDFATFGYEKLRVES